MLSKAIFISIFTLLTISAAFADAVTFQREYAYQASEIDSKVSCRAIALEQVKRLLLEELGTFLISETEVKSFQLTKDQVTTLTAGIVSTEIIDEKWDGKTYSLRAKISADPNEVAKSVDILRKDHQKTKELEESRKKASELSMEIERLKNELGTTKGSSKKRELKPDTKKIEKYNNAVNKLSATDWYEKGYSFYQSGSYKEAIDGFSKAIELDTELADAYSERGFVYGLEGYYYQAIIDYDKAIELNHPYMAGIFSNRGVAYFGLNNYEQAIKDYTKSLQLINGANSLPALKQFLLPTVHFNRGISYLKLGIYREAIKDFDKSIELNFDSEIAYFNRGLANHRLGIYREAIKDFSMAIELNPLGKESYMNRGAAYGVSGNYQQAIDDYKVAARLGLKEAQDFLTSKGIAW